MTNRAGQRRLEWSLAIALLALMGLTPASMASEGSTPVTCDDLIAAVSDPYSPREVIVRARGADGELAAGRATEVVHNSGGEVVQRLPLIGGTLARLPLDRACRLDDEPGIVVTPNVGAESSGEPEARRVSTSYPFTVRATDAWSTLGATGAGIAVAVVDSGVASTPDLGRRVTHVRVNPSLGVGDRFGHGTHVAGVIAGRDPLGRFVGIAPDAHIVDVKVLDSDGMGDLGTVLTGLQWVSDNAVRKGIRVVNLSIGTGEPLGYRQHPLNAAVEALWRQGLVVVAAGGNSGPGSEAVSMAPGNDPFVITAGGLDDAGTRSPGDDSLAPFTSVGTTVDGYAKPDLLAPAVGVQATLAPGSLLMREHPDAVSGRTLRMSGTSVSAAVVSGVAAGVLGHRPALSPDLVKAYLTRDSRRISDGGVVDELAVLVDRAPIEPANAGLTPAPTLDGLWGEAESQASWARASWARASWARASWARATW